MALVPIVPTPITEEQPSWWFLEEGYLIHWFYYALKERAVIDSYVVRDLVLQFYDSRYAQAPIDERRTPEQVVLKLYALLESHLNFRWFLGIPSVVYTADLNKVTVGDAYYMHIGGEEEESNEYWMMRKFPCRHSPLLEKLCQECNMLYIDYVWLVAAVGPVDARWLGRPNLI